MAHGGPDENRIEKLPKFREAVPKTEVLEQPHLKKPDKGTLLVTGGGGQDFPADVAERTVTYDERHGLGWENGKAWTDCMVKAHFPKTSGSTKFIFVDSTNFIQA
jgi:hypothetical protein